MLDVPWLLKMKVGFAEPLFEDTLNSVKTLTIL